MCTKKKVWANCIGEQLLPESSIPNERFLIERYKFQFIHINKMNRNIV